MSTLLEKTGKRLFSQHLEQYAPADPLYETYTNSKGKQKRRKRQIPPGLSKRDARILKKLMSRAHHLDKGFSLCGMRFGWTFLIGLIPVVGDVADITLGYLLIIRPAMELNLPNWLLRRMLVNSAASAGVGVVPFAGDVFVGMFKANSRNVALVEEFLRIRGEEFIKMYGMPEESETKTGWFGWKKKAAKTTTMSKKDVEQVKPGAGMEDPEVKDTQTPGVQSKEPSKSTSGSSRFAFFGSRSKAPSSGAPTNSEEANTQKTISKDNAS